MTLLPDRGWQSYEAALQRLAERRRRAKGDDALLSFLASLGLVNHDLHTLSKWGADYYAALFIRGDSAASSAILHTVVMSYPPATALAQMLAGVPGADRTRAESVLRSQGFHDRVTDRAVGSLLTLMGRAGIVEYVAKKASVRVLTTPMTEAGVPPSIYVSPETPFGNKIWLRRILSECSGHIDWLDRHFQPVAFEAIWEAADGSRINRVRILSGCLESHEGKRARRQYNDLKTELTGRSVELSWRRVPFQDFKDTHDRWIIGANSARNVPDVNTIYSGNNSEMNLSASPDRVQELFEKYWTIGAPVESIATTQ